MERENNNTVVAVVITILVMLVLGFGAYFVYDKFLINNSNEPNTEENNDVSTNNVKELGINDPLISSLKYPIDIYLGIGYADGVKWTYKNISINEMTRENMMHAAAQDVKPISVDEYETTAIYSATDIQDNYKKIFGPDTEYINGDIEGKIVNGDEIKECAQIYEYDNKSKTYIAELGCGGDSFGYRDILTKTYKAEQKGDDIYVYSYVQSVLVGPEDPYADNMETVAYLLDYNNNKTTKINPDNYKNIIYSMMNKGEVGTYKWTFKKQSDGKYYFYSGSWEN